MSDIINGRNLVEHWKFTDARREKNKVSGARQPKGSQEKPPGVAIRYNLENGVNHPFAKHLLNVVMVMSGITNKDNAGEIMDKIKRIKFTTETDGLLPFESEQKDKKKKRLGVSVEIAEKDDAGQIIVPVNLSSNGVKATFLYIGSVLEFQKYAAVTIE